MSDKIRAVMCGCGGMSRRWVAAATELSADVELVGFVDINQEAAEKLRAESQWTDATAGTDLAAVLKESKANAVFDCTIPEAHVNVTLTALAHDCHVLGEKPLADSMENAHKMVAAATEAGKVYSVIQNRRYANEIRTLQQYLAGGELGKIVSISSDFFIGAHFGGFRDRMKHVLLLDMAIHTFDAARFLTGADPLAVYCQEWNPSNSWFDHDAAAIALFEMTNDIRYTYRGSWCAEGLNTTWESQWHIVCERGGIRWDGAQNLEIERVVEADGFFSKCEPVKLEFAEHPRRNDGHTSLMDEFVDCVRSGATPNTICSDNIKSLSMVFGAIESAESAARVVID